MALRRAGIVVAATASLAQAQPGGATPPAFEVASIKPSGPQSIRGSEGGPGRSDPGRYRFSSASLLDLIAVAYDLKYDFQISSPFPLDRQNFDLVAKVPEGTTKQQFRSMMQNPLSGKVPTQAAHSVERVSRLRNDCREDGAEVEGSRSATAPIS